MLDSVIDGYVKRDGIIRVVHKENGGLALARKRVGVDIEKYIGFYGCGKY